MERMLIHTECTVNAGLHSALINYSTVVQDRKADKSIGIDVLVFGGFSYEDDFRRLNRLNQHYPYVLVGESELKLKFLSCVNRVLSALERHDPGFEVLVH